MHTWRPVRSPGSAVAFLAAACSWVLAIGLVRLALAPISGLTFWLLLGVLLCLSLGVLFLYWGVARLTLRYTFDRNGLVLHWGGNRQIIPMNRVTAVRPWAEGESVRERGLRWPGCHRGRGRSATLGRVEFYATAGRPAQVLVCTEGGTFVLSPRHPEEFIREVEIRRHLGITRQLAQEYIPWWPFRWSLWSDRPLLALLGAALAANLALLALLCHRFPILDPQGPIHFTQILEAGTVRTIPDYIALSQDLFKLPAFGLLLLGSNFLLGLVLHRRQRALALFLTVVALAVQVLFGLGTFYILTRWRPPLL
ncbi:MAG: PH domain-containing protein [Chloroflexia bacterium]